MMANMPQSAYQGKALTPGSGPNDKRSQGLATAAVAANKVHPKNEPPMSVDRLVPRHPNEISNPGCCD